MKVTYAIGDIHGMYDALVQLVDKIGRHHGKNYPEKLQKFVFVGDYVDRGPDSEGVIKFLMALSEKYECVFLRGNHEDMLLHDVHNFIFNGGRETLKSYGWQDGEPVYDLAQYIPEEHVAWFRATRLWHKDELRSYCHAGIYRHLGGVENQSERVLLWVRNEFLLDPSDEGGYVVHGHTPMEGGKWPREKDNRINLDTGAVFGGCLTAAVFSEEEVLPVHIIQVDCPKEGPY